MTFVLFKKKWILGSAIFFSGCVSLPKDVQRENLISPPSLETCIDQSLNSGFFTVGHWPKERWWETFGSAELNHLITEAIEQNPTIHSVEERVEFARQSAKVARSRLFPLIFFDANESWEYLSHNGLYRALNPEIPLNANLVDLTLSFSYEFDFWGKNKHLFKAALGEEKAREAEAASVQLIIAASLAQAFFALKTNLMRKELYEELYQVRKEILNLQNLLQDKALLSKLPPLFSQENLLEAEKLVQNIREEVESNKHLINILVGRGPDAPLNLQAQLPQTLQVFSIPDNLSLNLLSRRPDLMAQIWRVEALAHEVGAAKADFYPNINLKTFIGLESVLYRLLLKPQSKTAGLQPAIHLPLFTAGAIRANIRAKKALFDEAVFTYNNLILRSASEVADLLVLAQSIFQQKLDQDQIIQAAQARYHLTAHRQLSGLDNALSSYFVKEELILKQLDNATLLYSQYLAAVKLFKALGGGYQSEYALPLTVMPILKNNAPFELRQSQGKS
jgi:NodT family efflux transporter outer membrane factor (OMF) lipoprotein